MARSILVIGESGSGKTTSCRTLDPKTTYYIDADGKGLSFRGWRKNYNAENKNYFSTSNAQTIRGVLRKIAEDPARRIKTVVIDTLNAIMVDDEFRRMNEKGYDKWVDLAASIYGIISDINAIKADINVVCMAHTQTDYNDNGEILTRMKTSGKKLDKIVVESKFTTVLLAKGNDGRYIFETRAHKSTAKTPMGCFEQAEIPNDMAAVIAALDAYEEGE